MEPIRRSLPTDVLAGGGRILRGLIPYDSPAVIVERGKRFTEVIRRGAFARATTSPSKDVLCTFNHQVDRLLGRSASGTLRLTDTPEGLRYEVDLPESAADVRELLARGDLRGSSFTAVTLAGGEKWTGDLCELTRLELFELGPVVMPYYAASEAVIRAGDPGLPSTSGLLSLAQFRLMERS